MTIKNQFMKTFNQFMIVCSLSLPSFADGLTENYYGDSIAVGYGGNNPGRRRVGASPAEVYSQLQTDLKDNPNRFKGQTVNISTGVSNNPGDFRSIERQMQLLQKSGAKVNVLGAANGRYDNENAKLASLSSQYGANFKGGFKPGKDGVHPASYSSYNTGTKPETPKPKIAKPETPKPAPKPETISPTLSKSPVLSKLKGVQGTGIGKDFVAKKWSDTEGKRYKKYGGK